jgi:hypothetical protein
MRSVIKVLVLLGLLSVSGLAHATQQSSLTVKQIFVRPDGRALILFSNAFPAIGCDSSNSWSGWLAIDTNQNGGKNIFSLLLSAKLAGSLLTVTSQGTCTIFAPYSGSSTNGNEDLMNILMQ